jgi:hypothetical protein
MAQQQSCTSSLQSWRPCSELMHCAIPFWLFFRIPACGTRKQQRAVWACCHCKQFRKHQRLANKQNCSLQGWYSLLCQVQAPHCGHECEMLVHHRTEGQKAHQRDIRAWPRPSCGKQAGCRVASILLLLQPRQLSSATSGGS